ncbi:MAG TPA: twin transmembrane helix small protein [Gammaproteobacteria bacterium]|nr:twin transmembrane helix small protein [Gammaproteobacteria bacterium]
MTPLSTFLTTLVIIGLVATIVGLGWGLFSMAAGGNFDRKHATQFMSARVGFQALTIVLLLVALYLTLA